LFASWIWRTSSKGLKESLFGKEQPPAPLKAHLEHGSEGFHVTPWPSPGPHLKDNASQTPDVNLCRIPLALDRVYHFRCHPKHGTFEIGRYDRIVGIVCEGGVKVI
jgi:hypothetical protein